MKFLTQLVVIIFIAITSIFDAPAATVYLGVGESYETVVDNGVGYSYIGIESVTCDNPSVSVEKIGLKVRATVKAYFTSEATVKTTIRYKLYPSQPDQYRYHSFTIMCKSNGGDNENNPDDSFWLVETIMEVEIGKTKQLHYNFYNNDYAPITWSSDNASIARVDDSGKVTGVSKGTTYVRANTTNGRSSSCKITVIDQLVWKDGDTFIVSPYNLPNLKCQIISVDDRTCRLGAMTDKGVYNGLYGGAAFYDKTLNLPSTVKAYDGTYFRITEVLLLNTDLYPSIEKVIFPNSVLKLDEGCFGKAKGLKEVILPELLSEIPNNTFAGCNSLTHVEIPYGITRIGSFAFAATNLKTFIMSEDSQLTTVDNGAFNNCDNLEIVDFGTNIKIVGSFNEDGGPVFRYCNNLREIKFRGKNVCNAANLFEGDAIKKDVIISVPEIVLQAYSEHPYWKDFEKLYSIEHGDEYDYILIYFDAPYYNLSRTYRIFRNREVDRLIYSRKDIEIQPSQYLYFYSSNGEFYGASDNNIVFSKDCDFVYENGKINHKLKIGDDMGSHFTLDNSLNQCFVDITIDLEELSIVFSTDKSNLRIDDIEIEGSGVDTEYFNIQGIRIEKPLKGIYIVKRGNKVTKKLLP